MSDELSEDEQDEIRRAFNMGVRACIFMAREMEQLLVGLKAMGEGKAYTAKHLMPVLEFSINPAMNTLGDCLNGMDAVDDEAENATEGAFKSVEAILLKFGHPKNNEPTASPVATTDDPEADCTDAAHPAWWRGQEHGVVSLCQQINEILDGKEIAGVCSEPWESTRRRLTELSGAVPRDTVWESIRLAVWGGVEVRFCPTRSAESLEGFSIRVVYEDGDKRFSDQHARGLSETDTMRNAPGFVAQIIRDLDCAVVRASNSYRPTAPESQESETCS